MVAARRLEPGRAVDALAPATWVGGVPLPTPRAVKLLALAAMPALAAVVLWPLAAWGSVALGLAIVLTLAFDAARIPAQRIHGARPVPELLNAFADNPLALELENRGPRSVSVSWLDVLPDGVVPSGELQLAPGERTEISLRVHPPRGLLRFLDVHLRVEGPLRLMSRDARLPAQGEARSYPDLREPGEGLMLARPRQDEGLVRLRRLGEGREFDALRPYRDGDDLRAVDWKASARRSTLVAREYVPERNQVVLLLLDCGRFFVGREGGRQRLDFTLEAALRLARTALERGDAVGLLAFGAQVRCAVPPAKGRAQLKALVEASFQLQPELEESDYGAAFDRLGKLTSRRALVCAFTDLVDEDASRVVLARAAALRPKHLPLVVTLLDAELARLEAELPANDEAAFARSAAVRLLRARAAAVARLRDAGATVVSAASDALSASAINAYLRIKQRGLL